jgi:hypothetical protein
MKETILTKKIQAAREAICRACDSFRVTRCLELRKERGCSACSTPWQSVYVKCPRGKWNEDDSQKMISAANAKKQLEPEALAVIKERTEGKVLELGTGSMKGTHAALHKAIHIVTIDHSFPFTNMANIIFKDDARVTALCCHLQNKTYDLPEGLENFDTIIVDGPIGKDARYATLEKVIPLLKHTGKLIVDDAKRDEAAIHHWAKHYGLQIEFINTPRGMAVLTYES